MQEVQMWERVLEEIKGVRSDVNEFKSQVNQRFDNLEADLKQFKKQVSVWFSETQEQIVLLEQNLEHHERKTELDKKEVLSSIRDLTIYSEQQKIINQLLSKQLG